MEGMEEGHCGQWRMWCRKLEWMKYEEREKERWNLWWKRGKESGDEERGEEVREEEVKWSGGD